MQTILYWSVLAGCVLVASLFFFFRAITKKSMQHIWYSLMLLLIAGVLGARAGWLFVQKSYHAVVRSVAAPTAEEVYKSMFGKHMGCVKILHGQLPVVPRIDCCTYLEFNTCPEELQRIIAQSKYEPATAMLPPGTQPAWWQPSSLGNNAHSLSCSPDEDSYQLLVFSADSTHAFYCYSTD